MFRSFVRLGKLGGLGCSARLAAAALAASSAFSVSAATAPGEAPRLSSCRLRGLENAALCGQVQRPLDPAQPQGKQIQVHYAVVPALARNKRPDPVFLFAGGPGQSAVDLAGAASRLLARLSNRRDVVLVDQRGTGRTAPLVCPDPPPQAPLADGVDMERQIARLAACRADLERLPYGDLRHYATWVAVRDVDAVRQALGAARINLVGASYGTRAALEYARQFPQSVRRMVLDGVAPPDMVLPTAFSQDNQAAFDQVMQACEADRAGCARRYPALRTQWQAMLASLPREVNVAHPVTGLNERLTLTRDALASLVRGPLYVPALAAGLPAAIEQAAQGRFEPLFGLSSGLGGSRGLRLAEGMHFSVVCSEDLPRLAQAADVPGRDFGSSFATLYQRVCAGWPRSAVPAAFYRVPVAPAPALLLSGGADPATPPRHAERTARALGPRARHVVVAQAGHGVMALPCMRDVVFKFIDAEDDAAAAAVELDCARAVPRPPAALPLWTPEALLPALPAASGAASASASASMAASGSAASGASR